VIEAGVRLKLERDREKKIAQVRCILFFHDIVLHHGTKPPLQEKVIFLDANWQPGAEETFPRVLL
jgi:hypothetical protein